MRKLRAEVEAYRKELFELKPEELAARFSAEKAKVFEEARIRREQEEQSPGSF